MKKILLLFMILFLAGIGYSHAQTSVSGNVTSADDGAPIPGATIMVKGSTIGTITDIDGTYQLEVPENYDFLVFTFVGMKSQEVEISGGTINIALEADVLGIEEVMVVAYGTATKESFTGAATVVESETLEKRQVSNVTQALTGVTAGIQVASNTGQPGETANIRIRGVGSQGASSAPLFVVDGIPFGEDISVINPSDIETITVLKDAASSALYGARGANGVILITTKKGQKGSVDVNLDVSFGVNQRSVPEYNIMTDPSMYYEKYYEGIYTDQYVEGTTTPSEAHTAANALLLSSQGLEYNIYDVPTGEDLIQPDGKINTNASKGRIWDDDYWLTNDDWYDELFGSNQLRKEYNLSVGTGSEKSRTYISMNYLNDEGIISNSGFKRISARVNTDYDVKKWLKLGGNIGYSTYESKYPDDQEGLSSKNLFYVSRIVAPIYPLYVRGIDKKPIVDDMGHTLYDFGTGEYPGLNRPIMSIANPASDLRLDLQRYNTDFFTLKGFAHFYITEGLKISLNVGYNNDNTRYLDKGNAYYGQSADFGGNVYKTYDHTSALTLQQLATYKKSFGNHDIDILLGHETYDRKWSDMFGIKYNLFDPESEELSSAILRQQTGSTSNAYFVEGYLSRLQYNYSDKYFLTASFRRDGSSRFAPENRWGNFWSIGASWLLNKESFLENTDWVDFLKLKASYGAQGNDALLDQQLLANYYPYMDQYEVKNSNDDFALELTYKGNRDISWETSYNLNAGVDFTILNALFEGSVEFFSRKVEDMLYYLPVPPSGGYGNLMIPNNIGSMRNMGVDFSINSNIIRGENVNWSVYINGTHYKNEILSLPEQFSDEEGFIDTRNNRILKVGGSIYDHWTTVYAGVNPETGASQWRTTNEDGTHDVTEDYSEASQQENSASPGSALPDLQGGFGTLIEAYGFDLSVSLTYSLGGLSYDYAYRLLMHGGEAGEAGSNWHKDILDSWTPDNKNTDIPRVDYGSKDQNSRSDRFYVNSSYLSFNNVTLGYTFPENISNSLHLGYIRLYFVADNLALMSKRKGLDPRQGFDGDTDFIYSPIRTMSLGAKIKF